MGRRRKPESGVRRSQDLPSQDLPSHPMPRPNLDYTGSPAPSLPSVIADIDVNEADGGEAVSKGTKDTSRVDIRNTIGVEHNIHKDGNAWYHYNWSHPQGKDDDEALISPPYLSAFVTSWLSDVCDRVIASFKPDFIPEHWRCDIDTNTGYLLPPVDYPESKVDLSQIDPDLEWCRKNWTSTLLMERHAQRPRFGYRNRRKPRNNRAGDQNAGQAATGERQVLMVHEPEPESPKYEDFVPRIPCFLRPAEQYDMDAVRLIYDWEMQHGLQTLNSEPLSLEDFEKMLSDTRRLGMPFVVAVRGSARGRGLTKGNLTFSPYRQMLSDAFDPAGDKSGEILGFGFLSVWEPGLAGSGTCSSRATAKINVFVHPEHRRKKIGFSLLDVLLTSVSNRHFSQAGYDFIDPDNRPVYKGAMAHDQRYFRLYLHYLVRHRRQTTAGTMKAEEKEQQAYDDDLPWVRKLLEQRFGFTEVVRFEAVHRSAKCREGPVYWLDQVVFEHTCHWDPPMRND